MTLSLTSDIIRQQAATSLPPLICLFLTDDTITVHFFVFFLQFYAGFFCGLAA